MIANAAFLAALDLPRGRLAGGRTRVPLPVQGRSVPSPRAAPWRRRLVFFNLCAPYYSVARWLFLRDTGRKLATSTGN